MKKQRTYNTKHAELFYEREPFVFVYPESGDVKIQIASYGSDIEIAEDSLYELLEFYFSGSNKKEEHEMVVALDAIMKKLRGYLEDHPESPTKEDVLAHIEKIPK